MQPFLIAAPVSHLPYSKHPSKPMKILFTVAAILTFGSAVAQNNKKDSDGELFTIKYEVPPMFLAAPAADPTEPVADPFAERLAGGAAERLTAKETLEAAGVLFPKGASASYNLSDTTLVVRNTKAQHRLVEKHLDRYVDHSEKQILIIYEMVEVSRSDFGEWLFSNKIDGDGTSLRKVAQKWVKAGRGTVLETTSVMARSGQRAKTESIREHIHPTGYEPPEIPNEVTLSVGAVVPLTGVTPTAFHTKNLGTTLEVDPVLGADGETVDLNLAPEATELAGQTVWPTEDTDPIFQTRQAKFYTQKITTQIRLKHGRYGFLGTTKPRVASTEGLDDPIVLNFVRTDVSAAAYWSKKKGGK